MTERFLIFLLLLVACVANAQAATITSAEYYFDEDPGEGFGFPMDAEDGAFGSAEEALIALNVSTVGLSPGSYTVYVRVRDSEGRWSAPSSQLLSVKERPDMIVAAEYYIDKDPGVGGATPMGAGDGSFDGQIEDLLATAIPTGDLSLGQHVVGVRILDAQGVWSEAITATFEVIRPQRPVVMLSDTTHNFDSVLVGTDTTWTLTVSNPGATSLTVRSVKVSGEGFSADPASFTVASDGSASIGIVFAPVSKGKHTATLILETNDPDRPEAVVHLSGFGTTINVPPSIAVTGPEDERTGPIALAYRLSDADQDTLRLEITYSLNEGETWKKATVSGDIAGIMESAYVGQVTWNTGVDLKDHDQVVWVRMVPWDLKPGLGDTVFVRVDNARPTVEVIVQEGEQSGDVDLGVRLSDVGGDTLGIRMSYSLDGASTWWDATVEGKTAGIGPEEHDGSLRWKSLTDMKAIDAPVWIRVVAYDALGEGEPDTTDAFHLDNNAPPSLALIAPDGEQSDEVVLSYQLSDAENDTLNITCEYRARGVWVQASVSGATEGISRSGYGGSITWDSQADLPETADKVLFRITPRDNDLGLADTVTVLLDNLGVPSITLTDTDALLTEEQAGDVEIPYLIADDEKDAVDLACEYSTDSGTTWRAATVTGKIAGIDASAYRGTVVWQSSDDLPNFDGMSVRFRITPYDAHTGLSGETGDFHVDNNALPSVVLKDVSGSRAGNVSISYTLSDPEEDVLSISCAFRREDGVWQDATVLEKTEGIEKRDYGGHVIWDSAADLPEFVGSALLRITPTDNDRGQPDSTTVFVDNVVPSVVLDSPSEEQTVDVSIEYTITNQGQDPVHLSCAYSEDGILWTPATVTGAVTEIGPSGYAGQVTWQSKVDLPGRDLERVRFRITPEDIQEGVSDDTDPFHVDNDDPPSVSVSTPSEPVAGTSPIEYILSDAEGDTLSIGCFYSRDGHTWHPATVSEDTSGIVSNRYQGSVQWNSIRDVGYGDTLTARFRIVPHDRDEGSPGVTDVFRIRNWLGDYNHDLTFDMDDLAAFRAAWQDQDETRNLGPAQGDPPNWVPVNDDRIDFEDLRVFVVMWNWWHGQPESGSKLLARMSKPVSDGSDASVHMQCTHTERGLRLSFDARGIQDVIGAELLVRYDASKLRVRKVKRGNLFPTEDASVLFLHHIAEEHGVVVVDAIHLNDPPKGMDEMRSVAHLDLVRTGPASSETDIAVFYDLRSSDPNASHRGTIRRRMALTSAPKRFALHPNHPNPFNPHTTITYDVARTGTVRLCIYSLAGQYIRTLVDGERTAGSHSLTWDGTDDAGQDVASGVYLCRMETGTYTRVRKMLLIR